MWSIRADRPVTQVLLDGVKLLLPDDEVRGCGEVWRRCGQDVERVWSIRADMPVTQVMLDGVKLLLPDDEVQGCGEVWRLCEEGVER